MYCSLFLLFVFATTTRHVGVPYVYIRLYIMFRVWYYTGTSWAKKVLYNYRPSVRLYTLVVSARWRMRPPRCSHGRYLLSFKILRGEKYLYVLFLHDNVFRFFFFPETRFRIRKTNIGGTQLVLYAGDAGVGTRKSNYRNARAQPIFGSFVLVI